MLKKVLYSIQGHPVYEAWSSTQMEAHATASCIQQTVYIYTQKSGNGEYYWEKFDPLPPHTPKLIPIEYRILLHPFMIHLELCHISNYHYDVVTMFLPTSQANHTLTHRPHSETYNSAVHHGQDFVQIFSVLFMYCICCIIVQSSLAFVCHHYVIGGEHSRSQYRVKSWICKYG